MLSLKKINKQVVKAIPIPNEDTRPIKGYDICEEVYANIFLCAKKKSGKTSTIFKILKNCCQKKTVIYIFCSTAYKDQNWIEIIKHFKDKGMEVKVFTSIFEDGKDQLYNLINDLKHGETGPIEENLEEEEQLLEPDPCDIIIAQLARMSSPANPLGYTLPHDIKEDKPPKERKSKYRAPEFMIVFDDLSGELKSNSLIELLKKNRHYKTKMIISSQWIHDLKPESRKQMDLFLVFKGFTDKKIAEIYKDCDSSIPFETFVEIYKQATEKPFSFMYIDTRSDKFRCNFNQEFMLN